MMEGEGEKGQELVTTSGPPFPPPAQGRVLGILEAWFESPP
jgi:hypothetical protein